MLYDSQDDIAKIELEYYKEDIKTLTLTAIIAAMITMIAIIPAIIAMIPEMMAIIAAMIKMIAAMIAMINAIVGDAVSVVQGCQP